MSDWFEAEDHVERAHELYEAGRWDEAEAELRRALSLNPFRAEWHFNLGLTLEAAGRWEDAVTALHDALQLDPGDHQILLLLGINFLRLDRVRDAMECLEAARAFESEKPDSCIALIEAYTRLGLHEQAEEMFYRVLQFEGDHAQAYANIAESLIDRKEYARAMYCLREAANLDPTLPRVHARLGHVHAESGRHERARQLFLRELRENPGDVETLLDLGCLLVDMNRFGEASEKFRRVVELEPENADAHFYLGDLAQRRHRFDEARSMFAVVLRLDPEYPEARRRLAKLALDRGAIGEARRLLRRDLRSLREHSGEFTPGDLSELGSLLIDARLARDAQAVLRKLIEKRPEDGRAIHLLAVAQFQIGARAEGMELSLRAIKLDPTNVSALHNLALACVQERQYTRARFYVGEALKLAPDDHALRRLRLMLRLRRGLGWFGVRGDTERRALRA